jgi:holo-[acyl-carrier protein] synthase
MSVSVGIDIQSVSDVQASLTNFGKRYVERVFSPDEADFALAHPHTAARFLAGRFAAREAVLKVLHIDDAMAYWYSITVSPLDQPPLKVLLTDESHRRAVSLGLSSILITISAAGDLAIAVALADNMQEKVEKT